MWLSLETRPEPLLRVRWRPFRTSPGYSLQIVRKPLWGTPKHVARTSEKFCEDTNTLRGSLNTLRRPQKNFVRVVMMDWRRKTAKFTRKRQKINIFQTLLESSAVTSQTLGIAGSMLMYPLQRDEMQLHAKQLFQVFYYLSISLKSLALFNTKKIKKYSFTKCCFLQEASFLLANSFERSQ